MQASTLLRTSHPRGAGGEPRAQRGARPSVSPVEGWWAPAWCMRLGLPMAQMWVAIPERARWGLTSLSGPRVDAAALSTSGLLLCWLCGQWSEVGAIGLAGGLQGQDVLGDPSVEPGPRPLPDLEGETPAQSTGCRAVLPVPCPQPAPPPRRRSRGHCIPPGCPFPSRLWAERREVRGRAGLATAWH